MDPKALLRLAADKLSPTDAAKILAKSDLVFLNAAQWHRFDVEKGGFRSETGGSGSFSVGNIEGVRLLKEDEVKSFGNPTPMETKVGPLAPKPAQIHPTPTNPIKS